MSKTHKESAKTPKNSRKRKKSQKVDDYNNMVNDLLILAPKRAILNDNDDQRNSPNVFNHD